MSREPQIFRESAAGDIKHCKRSLPVCQSWRSDAHTLTPSAAGYCSTDSLASIPCGRTFAYSFQHNLDILSRIEGGHSDCKAAYMCRRLTDVSMRCVKRDASRCVLQVAACGEVVISSTEMLVSTVASPMPPANAALCSHTWRQALARRCNNWVSVSSHFRTLFQHCAGRRRRDWPRHATPRQVPTECQNVAYTILYFNLC